MQKSGSLNIFKIRKNGSSYELKLFGAVLLVGLRTNEHFPYMKLAAIIA